MKQDNPMTKTSLLISLLFIASLGFISGCSDDEVSASAANGGGTTNNGNLGDSTPTGRIRAPLFILYDPAVPNVFDEDLNFTQQSVTITAFAEDINDLVEVNGQTVNFKAEWGGWLEERDSCVISNGSCSVTWISGSPFTAPGSCLVAITAYTSGEESFFDSNDNNQYDSDDEGVLSFAASGADLDEPFLDINNSGDYTAGIFTPELKGELIDIIDFDGTSPGVKDGVHTAGNNTYDGSLCTTASACSGRESMIIHTRSILQIQEPFNETGDVNGNGTPDEENILYCGSNPF